MNTNTKINNKKYIQTVIEQYLSQIGYNYSPTKPNKKKIQELFDSLSFFFFNDEYQNILYDILNQYCISDHIDRHSDMKKLCYCIYEDVSLKLGFTYDDIKTYDEFYKSYIYNINTAEVDIVRDKLSQVKSYVFLLIIIVLLIFMVHLYENYNFIANTFKQLFPSKSVQSSYPLPFVSMPTVNNDIPELIPLNLNVP